MKRKVLAALLCVAMVATMVVGCGSSSDTSDDTSTGDAGDVSVTEVDESEYTEWNWPSADEVKIGYSQADLASTWRIVENEDMEKYADEYGWELTILNAEGDTEQQLSDVESLIAQGCNVIVITAIDADAIQPALDTCRDQQIPVILKSRGSNGVPGVDYVTFCAHDFVEEGYLAGKWLEENCDKDTIKVAEVQGVIGGTDVRDRSQGFHNAADEFGNFDIVAEQSANWSRSEAQELAANIIQSTGGDIDAFYCHNDEMALGVTLACQAAGLTVGEDVYVLGVDGMTETFDAIKDGTISSTVTCTPKCASTVFECIQKGIDGETLETIYNTEDYCVDATNVDEYYDLGF